MLFSILMSFHVKVNDCSFQCFNVQAKYNASRQLDVNCSFHWYNCM